MTVMSKDWSSLLCSSLHKLDEDHYLALPARIVQIGKQACWLQKSKAQQAKFSYIAFITQSIFGS